MFDNIGRKIMVLAKVICWVGISLSVIIALIMFSVAAETYSDEETYILLGFLFLVVGTLASWVGSFFMYGFGELIDKVCDIDRNTRGGERKSEAQTKIDSERITKIERLRSQGLITEEEYRQAISKGNDE